MKRIFHFGVMRRALFALLLITPIALQAQPHWTKVPTPNPSPARNQFYGISGTSASDIWAVGQYQAGTTSANMQNLMMHWNGNAWQVIPVANPSIDYNALWDVEAISTTQAWAVGSANFGGGAAQSQLLRWNGTSWAQQSLPFISGGSYLFSLNAISPTDIWAVGGKTGSPFLCYSLHYNGSSWNEVAVPAVGTGRNHFNAVWGLNANDVWAVGSWGVAVGDYHFLAMHWNGSSWSNVPIPATVNNGVDGELMDVKVVGTNDVWALGYSLAGGDIKLHWDGTSWTQMPSPGGGGCMAALSPNNIYEVGNSISHWDGNAWSLTDTLPTYPYLALIATVVLPGGQIWAAGSTSDSANIFQTAVYRTDSSAGTTGIATLPPSIQASAYPNPFIRDVSVTFDAVVAGTATLTVSNMLGQRLLQQGAAVTRGKNRVDLHLSGLTDGVYLLQVSPPGGAQQTIRLQKTFE